MWLANPWGLLGLLAIPAIVALHMMHRRFPVIAIAGRHLWGPASQMSSAGRRPQRLPITRSLLLELFAAVLCTIVLVQPRFGRLGTVPHLVVVLDNSASMLARDGATTFRDAAISEVSRRMDHASWGTRVTLIATGRPPTVLAGPALPWAEAREQLTRWQPSEPQHDFRTAWDFAAQHPGERLFLTDRISVEEDELPAGLEVMAIGRPLDNVAITAARWTLDPQSQFGTVSARLVSFARQPTTITVQLVSGNDSVGAPQTHTLSSGMQQAYAQTVPVGIGQLTLSVRGDDDSLAVDSRVQLLEPTLRRVDVSLELAEDHPARKPVERVLDSLPAIRFADPETADLRIASLDSLPPSNRRLWWLGFPNDPDKTEPSIVGPFLLERQNALLSGVTLDGIVWGPAAPLSKSFFPLVSAAGRPLYARLEGTQTTAFVLNLHMDHANIAESPDWPILISNLVESCRDAQPGLRRWNYRQGETIEMTLSERAGDQLQLVHRLGTHDLPRFDEMEIPTTFGTGTYELRDENSSIGRFAVNFQDAKESDLRELDAGTRHGSPSEEASVFLADDPNSWLAVLAILATLLVILLDWIVLQERRVSAKTRRKLPRNTVKDD